MGGCRDPNCAVSKRGEERAAGCGLLVTSVLHNFTARLPQVPELGTHDQENSLLTSEHVSAFRSKVVEELLHTLTHMVSYSQCVQL